MQENYISISIFILLYMFLGEQTEILALVKMSYYENLRYLFSYSYDHKWKITDCIS